VAGFVSFSSFFLALFFFVLGSFRSASFEFESELALIDFFFDFLFESSLLHIRRR
jgi:hypothetical protein